jgi:hypothetical protein
VGRQSRRKRETPEPPAWTKLQRMTTWRTPDGLVPIPDNYAVFKNSRYMVTCCRVLAPEPFGNMIWLSIKRLDREPIHDWRDLQRIKNELCGPECEAVELYPAESRNHDTSNQMHLWVTRPEFQYPFGYKHRVQVEHPEDDPMAVWAKQRPWEDDNRPPDVLRSGLLMTNKQSSEVVAPLSLDPFDGDPDGS